jgi:hypothetical protein
MYHKMILREISKIPPQFTSVLGVSPQVNVREDAPACPSVQEEEGERNSKSDDVRDRNPLVLGTDGEHVLGDGPGNGQGIELLDILTRPDVGAFDGQKERRLIFDNRQHDAVVQEGADDAANNLDDVCASRGQMDVLSELQVSCQDLSLSESVEGVAGEVKV